MKINPDEIKSDRIDEIDIDLQILEKELKGREREKRQTNFNDNFSNLLGVCCCCLKGLGGFVCSDGDDRIRRDKIIRGLLRKYIKYYRLNNVSKVENNNKKSKKLNSNIIAIDYDSPKFKKSSMRLYYNIRVYYILLFLNVFFPGFGTIIAAIGWGNTCKNRNRTKELLLRGVLQILTTILIVGWIHSISDALNDFENSKY